MNKMGSGLDNRHDEENPLFGSSTKSIIDNNYTLTLPSGEKKVVGGDWLKSLHKELKKKFSKKTKRPKPSTTDYIGHN
jgi:hypothetical protein